MKIFAKNDMSNMFLDIFLNHGTELKQNKVEQTIHILKSDLVPSPKGTYVAHSYKYYEVRTAIARKTSSYLQTQEMIGCILIFIDACFLL